jgi:hypothetical protein
MECDVKVKNRVSDFSWKNTGLMFGFGFLLYLLYGIFFLGIFPFVSSLKSGLVITLSAMLVIGLGNVKGLKWLDKVPAFIIGSAVVSGLVMLLMLLLNMAMGLTLYGAFIMFVIALLTLVLVWVTDKYMK